MSVEINSNLTHTDLNTNYKYSNNNENLNFKDLLNENIEDKTDKLRQEYDDFIKRTSEYNTQVSFEDYKKTWDFMEELSQFSPEELAQKDFQTALNALDELVDKNTGAKIDFNSFNDTQKTEILNTLSSYIDSYQIQLGEWLEYSKIEVSFAKNDIYFDFEIVNKQGENKNYDLTKMTRYMPISNIAVFNYDAFLDGKKPEYLSNDYRKNLDIEKVSKEFADLGEDFLQSYKKDLLYTQSLARLIDEFVNKSYKELLTCSDKFTQNIKQDQLLQELLREI